MRRIIACAAALLALTVHLSAATIGGGTTYPIEGVSIVGPVTVAGSAPVSIEGPVTIVQTAPLTIIADGALTVVSAPVTCLSISVEVSAASTVEILAAPGVGNSYLLYEWTVEAWAGKGYGYLFYGASKTAANVIEPIGASDTGGVKEPWIAGGWLLPANQPVKVTVSSLTGGGSEKIVITIKYDII